MKKKPTNLRNVFVSFMIFITAIVVVSCDEDQFLNETPRDFLSPEISYVTAEDFDAAIAGLYSKVRDDFFSSHQAQSFPNLSWTGTELMYTHQQLGYPPDWGGSILQPENDDIVKTMWSPAYSIIYDANVIIERAEAEQSELSDSERLRIQAEAYLFRGYMYKKLANLYGGVPIVLEEIKSPTRNFTRATREETYEQSASDLEFATQYLGEIDEIPDWRVNKLAAFHILSEVYISLERWTDAIEAASVVIDHPNTHLMTQRFGSMVDHPFLGGDVYWDLFRGGNQNRSAGNDEAIWVLQYAFNVRGGNDGGPRLEHNLIPRIWQVDIPNEDGTVNNAYPEPNTFHYGQGSASSRPSYYFFETLWEKSGFDEDMRNSEFNIARDFQVNNPASDRHGEWIVRDNIPIRTSARVDTMRNFFPAVAKGSTIGQHPPEVWHPDQTVEGSIIRGANYVYRDVYLIRLAETYLLRAEAHLGNNNPGLAAEDINVVRRRAHAPEVNASQVDINYLLDERARELHFEYPRLLTLTRLGLLVERTRKYQPFGGDMYYEHNNLWPLPFSEIEKNIMADIEQNPGY